MVEFASGKLTPEVARRRMMETTQEQLAALTNDPAFHAWQAAKARRDNRARVVTNIAAVAACVALVVTLALLKPAANAPAVPQAAMATSQEEAEAAQDAAAELTLRLRAAEEERKAAATRLAQLEAAAAARDAEALAAEAAAAELLARMTAQLEEMRSEVAAAEAKALAAANLAEASAAAATALLEAGAAASAPVPSSGQPTPEELFWPHPEAVLAELEAAQMLPGQLPVFFLNASSMALSGQPALAAFTPRLTPLALALSPAALATAAAAAVVLAVVTVLLHLRGRRRLAAEAARSAALAARLKEAAFAKDTVEQSLGLLERELQRRMKQLEDAQQAATDAASPRIGTAPSPALPGMPGSQRSPGELPPPPASLVEKFLRDHNFLAVQQEQMTEWLEMEQQFSEMQQALGELQERLAEKDAQIAVYEQDLSSVNEHSTLELRNREDQLAQVRAWLDEAQEELLETQAALQEREAECRRVSAQLEVMQAEPGAQAQPSDSAALLSQNQELVAQLQSVTAAYEAMRSQLTAATANGEALAASAFGASTSRPASAASTVPGTPADLSREVQSCLEMMRATRAQLADRLAHSQGVCEAMIADCQAGRDRRAAENLGAALQAAAGAAAEALEAAVGDAEEAASPTTASSPAPALAPFGSPTAVTPNPLFEAELEEGWEGEDELAAALAPSEGTQQAGEQSPCVLGTSSRHNASRQATPSPAGSDCATPDAAAACSMRAAWQAAHARVAEVRSQCNSWDLAGFVRQLGFEVRPVAPLDRADFEALRCRAEAALAAAATAAATSPERALAGEAMQAVREWEFPHNIKTPPPSPFWRMLSGLSA
ncbi:hypothetical protein ABPG75_006803 [Micractinium tetrahymenae]